MYSKLQICRGLDSQNQTWDLSCRDFHYCDDDGDDEDGDDDGDDDDGEEDGKADDDPGC